MCAFMHRLDQNQEGLMETEPLTENIYIYGKKHASTLFNFSVTCIIITRVCDPDRPLSTGRGTSWCVCRRERLKEEAGPTGWREMSFIWWVTPMNTDACNLDILI